MLRSLALQTAESPLPYPMTKMFKLTNSSISLTIGMFINSIRFSSPMKWKPSFVPHLEREHP